MEGPGVEGGGGMVWLVFQRVERGEKKERERERGGVIEMKFFALIDEKNVKFSDSHFGFGFPFGFPFRFRIV